MYSIIVYNIIITVHGCSVLTHMYLIRNCHSTDSYTVIKLMMVMNNRYKYDHTGNSEEAKSSSATSGAETARREKEGAAYCRRDKTGSAAQWFSHEHVENDVQQRGKGAGSGSANAARMRSESDCWYSYDKAATEETAMHKKRAASKPGGNEMHGVFHHASADN